MFAEQLANAISDASLRNLDHLSRVLWQGHGAGAFSDAEAQRLAEAIQARRSPARAEQKPIGLLPGRRSIFPPRRVQRSPDRAKSIERRRVLAASGVMPAALACRFTVGELAVLKIVADAIRDNGQCVLPIDAIAARAGVCRRLAQAAIRGAAAQGLLTVEERRRAGRRNDYNIVRVISAEWLTWIKRSGCKKIRPTDTRTSLSRKKEEAGDKPPSLPSTSFRPTDQKTRLIA